MRNHLKYATTRRPLDFTSLALHWYCCGNFFHLRAACRWSQQTLKEYSTE